MREEVREKKNKSFVEGLAIGATAATLAVGGFVALAFAKGPQLRGVPIQNRLVQGKNVLANGMTVDVNGWTVSMPIDSIKKFGSSSELVSIDFIHPLSESRDSDYTIGFVDSSPPQLPAIPHVDDEMTHDVAKSVGLITRQANMMSGGNVEIKAGGQEYLTFYCLPTTDTFASTTPMLRIRQTDKNGQTVALIYEVEVNSVKTGGSSPIYYERPISQDAQNALQDTLDSFPYRNFSIDGTFVVNGDASDVEYKYPDSEILILSASELENPRKRGEATAKLKRELLKFSLTQPILQERDSYIEVMKDLKTYCEVTKMEWGGDYWKLADQKRESTQLFIDESYSKGTKGDRWAYFVADPQDALARLCVVAGEYPDEMTARIRRMPQAPRAAALKLLDSLSTFIGDAFNDPTGKFHPYESQVKKNLDKALRELK